MPSEIAQQRMGSDLQEQDGDLGRDRSPGAIASASPSERTRLWIAPMPPNESARTRPDSS
ncbi:hypothetical protein DB30_04818 [Enhygromyxa salina]|uniref:Uncharacterized protein n=1 Tax=Enhygromyxa salina TaxID=215803 RepID=A0A0C2CZ45_9BACT|nr:hypothetical protein DB30_04818 [Enhygromyxa salina]